ncbi:hypothetical protein EV121DRAFT_191405, partial [Schizophyllum commune]
FSYTEAARQEEYLSFGPLHPNGQRYIFILEIPLRYGGLFVPDFCFRKVAGVPEDISPFTKVTPAQIRAAIQNGLDELGELRAKQTGQASSEAAATISETSATQPTTPDSFSSYDDTDFLPEASGECARLRPEDKMSGAWAAYGEAMIMHHREGLEKRKVLEAANSRVEFAPPEIHSITDVMNSVAIPDRESRITLMQYLPLNLNMVPLMCKVLQTSFATLLFERVHALGECCVLVEARRCEYALVAERDALWDIRGVADEGSSELARSTELTLRSQEAIRLTSLFAVADAAFSPQAKIMLMWHAPSLRGCEAIKHHFIGGSRLARPSAACKKTQSTIELGGNCWFPAFRAKARLPA